MAKTVIIIFALVFSSCVSCIVENRTETFPIINKSNEGQFLYYSSKDSIGLSIDSFINHDMELTSKEKYKYKKHILGNDGYFVDKHSRTEIGSLFGFKKETIFHNCKDGKIRFYFISESAFMKNPWDTIVKYQMYNRKMAFTKHQLDSMNWVIEYK